MTQGIMGIMGQQQLGELNESQHEAVAHIHGPILVIAGAGSGKTRVVTYRIVNLLNQGVLSSQILGLTFTNKAADEMKERVRKLTHKNVLICTFHSLGARILRESAEALGYRPDFTIYDEEDSLKILRDCLQTTQLKQGDIKTIREYISQAKNSLINPASIDLTEMPRTAAKHFLNAYSLYQSRLQESGGVDFDDLLYLPVKLFQEHPHILEMYQDRWTHLLIDEYQDTNHSQYQMVQMLAHKRKNICVVGDPDQSIYSWRGATIANILNFEKDYPGALVIRLEQNYRSTMTILEAANALIGCNESKYQKHLWSDLGEGEKIELFTARDEREEAQFVVKQVRTLHNRGIPLNQIVIFYRTNFQSRTFEDAFLFHGIPYVIVGGISFYQRREIKDILALLRMVQQGADHVAFTRTINLPKRGIGSTTIEKIRENSVREGMSVLQYCRALVEGTSLNHPFKLSPKQKSAILEYLALIEKLRVLSQVKPLKELVKAAMSESGYLSVLKEDPETYDDRIENLNELVSKAAEWSEIAEEPTLTAFLSDLALKTNLDEADTKQDSLQLMTIHNGKGLEFTATFLVGMEEDLFPHINAKNTSQQVEEERRLCYVGLTRAKQCLYLTHARQRYMWGMLRPMRPSRFLQEIPRRYIE